MTSNSTYSPDTLNFVKYTIKELKSITEMLYIPLEHQVNSDYEILLFVGCILVW